MRAAGSAQAGAGPYASNVQQQQQVEGGRCTLIACGGLQGAITGHVAISLQLLVIW